MIEILAVGVAVDHGAGEFQVAHAALEFVGRGLCVLHRKMREAEIAVRRLLHLGRQKIVGLARDAWSPWRCPARSARRGRQAKARTCRCRRCPSPKAVARRNRSAAPAPAHRAQDRRLRPSSANTPRSRARGNALRVRCVSCVMRTAARRSGPSPPCRCTAMQYICIVLWAFYAGRLRCQIRRSRIENAGPPLANDR